MDYEYNKFFLTQIKRNSSTGVFEKGVAVKDTLDAARQSFHAYLGAYGYGHDPNCDYVAVYIDDLYGVRTDWMIDNRINQEIPDGEV